MLKIGSLVKFFSILLIVTGGALLGETTLFIRASEQVEGKVIGYSAVQKLDRQTSECTAYSKSCAVEVSYLLSNGQSYTALLSQPLFGRSKLKEVPLFVSLKQPNEPRIASLNILFRNALFLLVLGATLFGLSFAIFPIPSKDEEKSGGTTTQENAKTARAA